MIVHPSSFRRPVLTPDQVALIDRLLDEGKNGAEIAAEAGCHLATVYRRKASKGRLKSPARPDAEGEWGVTFTTTRERCPGCGGLITQSPCRVCTLAKLPA